jgi:hypothetical protein
MPPNCSGALFLRFLNQLFKCSGTAAGVPLIPVKSRADAVRNTLKGSGALPTLELEVGKYHGKSKGKALKEGQGYGDHTLPAAVIDAVKASWKKMKNPLPG